MHSSFPAFEIVLCPPFDRTHLLVEEEVRGDDADYECDDGGRRLERGYFSVRENVRFGGASVVDILLDPLFMQFFQEFSIGQGIVGSQTGLDFGFVLTFLGQRGLFRAWILKIVKCKNGGFVDERRELRGIRF